MIANTFVYNAQLIALYVIILTHINIYNPACDSIASDLRLAAGGVVSRSARGKAFLQSPWILKPLFLLHYPLLILYAFLYPFDFSASHFHFDVRALIPFYYHITNAEYASLYVILRPAAAWLPVGIFIAFARSNAKRPFSYLSATLLAAVSQSVIEAGRAFTEYRHPDVTNVLLAALGAAAGIYLYHRALFPIRPGRIAQDPKHVPRS